MVLTEIESRLHGVKHTGSGLTALCPAHDDQRNSLSVSKGDDGKLLLHCHAGCDTDSICAAMGITVSDLFGDHGKDRKTGLGEIVAVYPYRDEAETVLYEAVRYKPKDFRQRVPLADGSYSWKLNGVRRVLYRLPELLAYEGDGFVFVVEGEKDVHSLVDHGLVATCNCGGAGKWKPEYSDSLRGRNVAIIPDNDEPGRKHGQQVALSIHGIAARIRVVSVPVGKDATDYLAAGHTADDLLRLVDTALDWKPGTQESSASRPKLVWVPMSQIERKPIHWLWPGRFPMGMLSLMVGYPGKGKSFVSLDMTARVSRGAAWPDDPSAQQTAGTVFLLNFEDDPHRATRPRLDDLGADLDRIGLFQGVDPGTGTAEKHFDILSHVPLLDAFVKEHADTRLVIIDPITSALGDSEQNTNADVRRAMTILNTFAERTGVAVVGISHFAKRSDVSALYKVMGSVAFTAVARAVWVVHQDEMKEGEPEPPRKLLFEKSNYGGIKTGLCFSIDNGILRWTDGIVYQTATEALNGSGNKAEKRQDAEQVILDCLASGLEKHADDLADEVLEKGISFRTYERARAQLRNRKLIDRRKDSQDGWFWFQVKKGANNEGF